MSVVRSRVGTQDTLSSNDADGRTLETDATADDGLSAAAEAPGAEAHGGKSYVGPLRAPARPPAIETDAKSAKPNVTKSYVGRLRAGSNSVPAYPAHAGHSRAPKAAGIATRGTGPRRGFADSVRGEDDSAPAGYGDVLAAEHVPTVTLIQDLRRARHKLQRAAEPELRLSAAIRALLRTERRLGRPLRIAICGETNAGKSSLANLLAGIESLPTAVISNTLLPTLIYYAVEPEVWTVHASGARERLRGYSQIPRAAIFRVEVGLPSPRLAATEILDLPGLTDSRSVGPVVDLAAHHVDAAIWCTVSTQAWKESERAARSMLPPRLNARSVLVATHKDLLREADRQKLLARLRDEVGRSFASIVLLSTLEAIAIRGSGRDDRASPAWIASGAEALETALAALLARVRGQRADAALSMTGRIAHRALARIEARVSDAS
jgi:GTPase SAR1 family protein